jgi:hypothetical protein
MSHAVTAVDDGSHFPVGEEKDTWQESWCLYWYDPIKHIGGFHHIGLQRLRYIADVWSWICSHGESVHKFHDMELPLPEDDFSDLHIGPFHLKTIEPLMKRCVTIRSSDIEAGLTYETLAGPISLSYDTVAGADVGRHHYEDMGRVTGTVSIAGQKISVRAFAFQDRSWGLRDWAKFLTYRAVWACFGQDLFLFVLHFTDPNGSRDWGYVHRNGRITHISAVDTKVEMNSDGATPSAVRVTAWTAEGEGIQIDGNCVGGEIQTHRDGFMMGNASCVFKMGGRIGTGYVEVSELKRLTPRLQAHQDRNGKSAEIARTILK